jgi:small subunit ribosomal protein S6
MKTYEAVVIFTSDENPYREAREFVKKEFETAGIVVTKEEELGEKLLSYPVRKHDRGRYVLYTIEGSAEALTTIRRTLKLRAEVLKHLITRQEVVAR